MSRSGRSIRNSQLGHISEGMRNARHLIVNKKGVIMAREMSPKVQEELQQIEEANAWFEYLESTRGLPDRRYAEMEPWAWARLVQRMKSIRPDLVLDRLAA
jgi:hypothetical protein